MHVSIPLGSKARTYAGTGPVLQYASAELEFEDGGTFRQVEESGFGGGDYGRIGFEWELWTGGHIGVFVRRVEATVELDDLAEDVDLETTQVVLAFTEIL